MQLILAIDGDARRAEQLAGLVRGKLAVELVQASSAGDGLQALGDRVPDLIITSPLLSPFDDGVLAEYLRGLGAAAAHVQTLRIPVFATAPKPSARSLFSLRRRKPAQVVPSGCDPNVFADEIGVYLQRAAEEKGTAPAAQAHGPADAPVDWPAAAEPPAPAVHSESSWTSRFESPQGTVPIHEPELPYVPFTAAAYEASIAQPEAPPAFDPLPDPVAERLAILRPAIADATLERAVSALDSTTGTAAAPPPTPYYGEIPVDRAPVHTLLVDLGALDTAGIDIAPVATPEPALDLPIIQPAAPASLLAVAAEAQAPSVLWSDPDAPDAARAGTHETIAETDAPAVPWTSDPVSPVSPAQAATTAAAVHEPSVPPEYADAGKAVAERPSVDPASAAAPATAIEQRAPAEPPPAPAAGPSAPVAPVATTPSFEAALAAIRAAWGRPARTTASVSTDPGPAAPAPAALATPADAQISVAGDPSAREPIVRNPPGCEPVEQPTITTPAAIAERPAAPVAARPPAQPASLPFFGGDDVREVADAVADQAAAPVEVPASPIATLAPTRPAAPARRHADRTRTRTGGTRIDKGRVPPGRPVQDEWGVFDPNQCGFSALVGKLDEVTDAGRTERTIVRVIAFS